MSAGVLAGQAGVATVVGRSDRPRRPRGASASAGFAPRLVGPSCIVASCASLQTATALATTLFASFGPAGTGALRFLAGAVALTTVVRPSLRGRSGTAWLTIVAMGGATAVTNLLLYEAIARIPLGTASTVIFLGPLALALLGTRRRLDVAWAAGAAVGVVLLTAARPDGSPAGVAFAFGAAVSVAASILLARRITDHTAGLDGVALSIAAAALLTLPVGMRAAFATPDPSDLAIVAVVGALGIAIPYALEFTALRRVGVKAYSILLSLDPAVAGLAGLILLGQRLSVGGVVGIGLVIVASIGAVATQPTRRAPPRSP